MWRRGFTILESDTIKNFLNDVDVFKTVLQKNQEELKEFLVSTVLPHFYNNKDIIVEEGYLCANGTDNIMMLAHMDTVFNSPPELIIYDETQNIITSPEGLGGDDRCGVFSIIALLKAGYKPYILFTEDEEVGGVGASKAANNLEIPENIKYLIQLDRRGSKDAVFYCCDNDKFKDFIVDYDFNKSTGSFTDINTLMPAWDICGVNLSIGYYNEHREHEYVKIDEMIATTLKVAKMIETLPEERHEFVKAEGVLSWEDTQSCDSHYTEMYPKTYGRDAFENETYCSVCGESCSYESITTIYSIEVCDDCLSVLDAKSLEEEVVYAQ